MWQYNTIQYNTIQFIYNPNHVCMQHFSDRGRRPSVVVTQPCSAVVTIATTLCCQPLLSAVSRRAIYRLPHCLPLVTDSHVLSAATHRPPAKSNAVCRRLLQTTLFSRRYAWFKAGKEKESKKRGILFILGEWGSLSQQLCHVMIV